MEKVREDFCGVCMVIPFAMAGAGVAGVMTKEDYKRKKQIIIISGISVLVVSLFLLWYYQDCESCKV